MSTGSNLSRPRSVLGIVHLVTVAEFLLARSEEELQRAGCRHEASTRGVRCSCERPSSRVLDVVARASLVRRCSGDPAMEPILRLLADAYACHPDYRSEWHPVG